MTELLWLAIVCAVAGVLAWRGARLRAWTGAAALLLGAWTAAGAAGAPATVLLWVVFLGTAGAMHVAPLRRRLLTTPVMNAFRAALPAVSDTERAAIDAGTVWWDRSLFSGDPPWRRLLESRAPALSPGERDFLDGPVRDLCRMLDEWEISHEVEGLPPAVWSFLGRHRFFGMIIPRRYGGLGFSAYAHSQVVMRVCTQSGTAGVVVMVPSSLGPAGLLLAYGTDAQKDHYLPRLARGDEIPCFALTGPHAGSDAAAVPDIGVVCRGRFGDRGDVLGIRLDFDKRYITLAPVATLIGLAFRLRDPENLLGRGPEPGITLALVPADAPGIEIGRRHRPVGMAFYNGPIRGHGVFIPVDAIIGGPEMAGRGWRMLMESLAAGRSISLPSLAAGTAKMAARGTGAYAAVRRQFGTSIGRFEGVQEALARIGGHTYAIDAARILTAGAVDAGERPSVLSAVVKYHLTERARSLVNDAMDVHGGRGICMGPRNYLARAHLGMPVAITVEGANILTRSLMIFGQGAIRSHPFVLREMAAARVPDPERGLREFDGLLCAHVRSALSNAIRALVLGLTGGRLARSPVDGPHARHFRHLTRASAAFAWVTDVSLLALGGRLKRMESLSARLGDILGNLYLASAALKRFEDQGRPEADRALLDWVCEDALARIQAAFEGFFRNFPLRWVARLLRLTTFPPGTGHHGPGDALGRRVAMLLQRRGGARDRLTAGISIGTAQDPLGRVEDALASIEAAVPAERILHAAIRAGTVKRGEPEETPLDIIGAALQAGVLGTAEADLLRAAEAARDDAIAVDDFAPESFGRGRPRRRRRTRGAAGPV